MEIETHRLRLRQWLDSDFEPFFQINSDPDVMRYFPALLSREESDKLLKKSRDYIEQFGWGYWAVELKNNKKWIGLVGFQSVNQFMPFAPAIEISWRLAKSAWRQSIATEAANACLHYGFTELNFTEVVSFTTLKNLPSLGVMKKLGMKDSGEIFDHPWVAEESGLKQHCLYRITKMDWLEKQAG